MAEERVRKGASRLNPVLELVDLSALSVSSVAPIFSVAAAGGLLVRIAGHAVIWAIVLVAIPFLLSSWLFLLLNRAFPHAGASYHWARRIVGRDYSNFQSWIILMAYLWSIPPILIPAASLTLSLAGFHHPPLSWVLAASGLWTGLAAAILLAGARATAAVTRLFLAAEAISVVVMGIWGGLDWHRAAVGSGRAPVHWSAVLVAMVLAATIVDGWEIDSYAAEESKKPRAAPGWGGLVGALMVVLYYVVIWPILLHEVPLPALARSPDVLITWSLRAAPQMVDLFRIAVLASTAGSLWLTTYILSRALYAMARDGIMPRWLDGVNRHQAPASAILGPLAMAYAVTCSQFLWPFLHNVFALVLGTAGFFLVAEFWLDGINALVWIWRFRALMKRNLPGYLRGIVLGVALTVVISLGTLEVLFWLWGPRDIGRGIDGVILGMLAVGAARVFWLRARVAQSTVTAVEGEDGEGAPGAYREVSR
ncbi:MAG: APC family permease [Firmicutes bacterium]|nr:APC family permease [Bacillota bacterium]